MPHSKTITTEECRRILGDTASGLSDEQIEKLRDDLARVAGTLYDEIARRAQTDDGLDAIRWRAYAHTCSDEEFWDSLDTSREEKFF